MTAPKPFAAERRACNRILREVDRMWRRYEPELKRMVRTGEYEAEMALRQELFRAQDRRYQDWIAIRSRMPPFIERRGRVDYLHPGTPENAHLLWPHHMDQVDA